MTITHTFKYPEELDETLFKYREAGLWAQDLVRASGLGFLEVDGPAVADGVAAFTMALTAAGTEAMLRLVCVALNQHAEQSPDDPTPSEEADRLEAAIRRAQNGLPACPACGGSRWKVDCTAIQRLAVVVGDDATVVHVDRCDGTNSSIDDIGSVECVQCGVDVEGKTFFKLSAVAATSVADADSEWRILSDYREL